MLGIFFFFEFEYTVVNTDYTSLSQKGHIKGDLIYMHIKRSQIHSSFCYIRRVCGRTHNTVLVPHELRGVIRGLV